jgi:hypothetical protein
MKCPIDDGVECNPVHNCFKCDVFIYREELKK